MKKRLERLLEISLALFFWMAFVRDVVTLLFIAIVIGWWMVKAWA